MTPSATATPHPRRTRRLAHCAQAAAPHQRCRPTTARTRPSPTMRAHPARGGQRGAASPPRTRINNTTAHLVPCLHVGAAIQQQPHRRLVAVPCCQHDRCQSILQSQHPATTTHRHASRHHGRLTTACPPPTHRPVRHPRPGHPAQCPTHTPHACTHTPGPRHGRQPSPPQQRPMHRHRPRLRPSPPASQPATHTSAHLSLIHI